ncbi:MAG: cysteine desulfurase [Proteobacteria bacterium]|nr:cysteine desulfurase [Pseudomonadota bacterium]
MTYLDHNATTRPDPAVVDALAWALERAWGNPSTLYRVGREAKAVLEHARERVAGLIGARGPTEVVFTSGGTEADALALFGVLRRPGQAGRHLVTTMAEHRAVLRSCACLEAEGVAVTYLPVDGAGRVDPEIVRRALRPDTALVSVLLANNEVGTVNPVAEIAAICRERGVLVHTDAVQACGKIPVDVGALGVDLLSLSGHKLQGPRGIGALWMRPGTLLQPLLVGGTQERGLRAGTEPVALAHALGVAAELATGRITNDGNRIRALRDRLWAGMSAAVPGARAHGEREAGLPNTLNVSSPGHEAEALILALDEAGIAVGTGSACTTGDTRPSHVLLAMGVPPAEAHSSIRLSLGRGNAEAEMDTTIEALARIVRA